MKTYICESAGWLSPAGAFYPCSYFEHYDTAYKLLIEFLHYDEEEFVRADDELERLGWLRISTKGDIITHIKQRMMQPQIDTIGDMILIENASELWKENMTHNLEYADLYA